MADWPGGPGGPAGRATDPLADSAPALVPDSEPGLSQAFSSLLLLRQGAAGKWQGCWAD